MAQALWNSLALHSAGHDVEVTLRGATLQSGALTAGPLLGASGPIHIAPVDAPGSVVYWTSSGGTSFQGFKIGAATPVTVLTPATAGATSTGGSTTCVSCHTSSPDGKLVIYTRTPTTTRDRSTCAWSTARRAGSVGGLPAASRCSGGTSRHAGHVGRPLLGDRRGGALDLRRSVQTAGRYGSSGPTCTPPIQMAGHPREERRSAPGRLAAWRQDGTAVAYVSSRSPARGVVSTAGADA
jgi:hypothetical protein